MTFALGMAGEWQYYSAHVQVPIPFKRASIPGGAATRGLHHGWLEPALQLMAVGVCQKQTETVREKPATSRLFNA